MLAPAVCPECHKLSTRELWNYCIGPPYVMHRDDWIRLAPLWFELTNQIRSNATLREIGGFYTDMVTFSQAVIKLGIKVDLRKDLMISLPNEEVARKDFDADKGVWRKLPYSHHYCQSYDLQMPGRHIYKHTHLHDVNFTNCDGGLEEAKKVGGVGLGRHNNSVTDNTRGDLPVASKLHHLTFFAGVLGVVARARVPEGFQWRSRLLQEQGWMVIEGD